MIGRAVGARPSAVGGAGWSGHNFVLWTCFRAGHCGTACTGLRLLVANVLRDAAALPPNLFVYFDLLPRAMTVLRTDLRYRQNRSRGGAVPHVFFHPHPATRRGMPGGRGRGAERPSGETAIPAHRRTSSPADDRRSQRQKSANCRYGRQRAAAFVGHLGIDHHKTDLIAAAAIARKYGLLPVRR